MDIKHLLVNEDSTIIEAMKTLDKSGKRIVFIAQDNKLKAVVTDGDIRRHILKGGQLDCPVNKIANYNPKFIYESEKDRAREFMQESSIDALPVLNTGNEVIDIIFSVDYRAEKVRSVGIPVVIMAGGLGTRLYPYTRILPKPLIPIGDKPIAEHIINRFMRYSCKEFHLIVNHKKNMIKSYFNDIEKQYKVFYVDEEEPLGTGGGLSLLKGKINSAFFLSNCDVLIDADYKDIYDLHKKQNNIITMICAFTHITIPYGVISMDKDGGIENITEKPEFSFLTNTGMYIVEPTVIEEMESNKAIGFPEIIDNYRKKGGKVGVYPVNEKCWLDMGQLEEMEEMRKRLGGDI